MATPVPFADTADLVEHLNKTSVGVDAEELEFHLEAATEAVEGWQGIGPLVARAFMSRVAARRCTLILPRTPIISVESATRISDGTVIASADLDVDGVSGIVTGSLSAGDYTVEYTAGRGTAADVPASLKLAVLIIAGHIWEIQRGPRTRNFVGHASADESSMHRTGAGYLIPNRAAHLMQPYATVATA